MSVLEQRDALLFAIDDLDINPAKRATRGEPGVGRRHAISDRAVGQMVEMRLYLLRQAGIAPTAVHNIQNPRNQDAQ